MLLIRYQRYLKLGKYEEGRPMSPKGFERQRFLGVTLADTGIQVSTEVLCAQYRYKLIWSAQQNKTAHAFLLKPITPHTLPHIILPYVCDPCIRAEATQALNKVRIEYLA